MAPAEPRSKAQWRAVAKERRTAEAPLLADKTDHVNRHLATWLATHRASGEDGWIVIFDALPGEVSLRAIEDHPTLDRIALTRTPSSGFELTIHPAASAREKHSYGYTQPVADSPVVPDEDVAAVLVPGLVFSIAGHRLGWGAGYYDRLLGRLPPHVARVGISDGLIVETLPSETHDITMSHIATTKGVQRVPLADSGTPNV